MDDEDEPSQCAECFATMFQRFPETHEPSDICDDCAQMLVVRLRAENLRLREALMPFAEGCLLLPGGEERSPDDPEFCANCCDWCAARAALASVRGKDGKS